MLLFTKIFWRNDSSVVVSFKKMMSQFMRKEHLLVEGFLGIATVTQFAF